MDCLEAEFGFRFEEAAMLADLAGWRSEDVVAILFHPDSLGLPLDDTLASILRAFPEASPILCHGFAEPIDWPHAAEAGAFHSIPVPIKLPELRQSLGFVWGARQGRRAERRRKPGRGDTAAPALAAATVA